MGTLRIAVVGAGNIARNYHLPSLRRLAEEDSEIELAALCDMVEDRAKTMAERFRFARAYTDFRAMLDAEAPDAVWVLVPFPVTREVAGYFLANKVPTFMEKPPGQNSRETRELLEIAQRHGTPNQVAFNRRHAPLLKKIKSLVAEVGVPVDALSCQFYRYNRSEDDFAFGTGLHGLDALRFLGSREVQGVYVHPGLRGSALVRLDFEGGIYGSFEMFPEVGIQSERYTVHAGNRTIVVDGAVGWLTLFPGFLQCFDAGKLTLEIDNALEKQPAEVVSGFYGESAHFISSLRGVVLPAPDLGAALRSVEIAEAANQAITRGDKEAYVSWG
jgi:predicted dehydrogenase